MNQQMPPRRQQGPKRGGHAGPPRKHKGAVVSPPPPVLPRVKTLPRELMPLIGYDTLKVSFDSQLHEFTKTQQVLPTMNLLKENPTHNLTSPIRAFTLTGEPDGYFVNINAEFTDVSGTRDLKLFVKRVHLVEPIPAMQCLYALPTDGALPSADNSWQKTLAKIHDVYNEAYIDVLCAATLSRLVDTKKSPHFIRFYGTLNARAEKYMYNITGEISSLRHERWFKKNKREGVFTIRVVGEDPYQKPLVNIHDEGGEIDCVQLNEDETTEVNDDDESDSDCHSDTPSTDEDAPLEMLSERPVRLTKMDSPSSGNSSSSTTTDDDEDEDEESRASSKRSKTSNAESDNNEMIEADDIDEYSTTSSDRGSNAEFFVEFKNFPVQVSLLECCEGTMDAMLDVEESTNDPYMIDTKDARWSAWVYQVISALVVAQHYYGFIHNDLHTNNIMWVATTEAHLYYKLMCPNNVVKYYMVPTYGKLMKIIDFGRASFWLKDRKKLLIPDCFDEGNDADGQYNCEPYYNQKEPKVDPNPSFDLCRLAISMFDALYNDTPPAKVPRKIQAEEPGRVSYETESELYNILWSWLTDDTGKNILRNPDDSERFPDFDLYKYIARHSKNCSPDTQAQHAYFDKIYRINKDKIPAGAQVWDLPLC